MRNLTIKRQKSFVACLATMKVYIEDATSNEIVINNVRCRKIGTRKNGETKSFVIGEEAARVFVIADTLSKGFSNEFYNLPAGTEDIFLSGKNKYNPASGNAFRFDGITDEAVLKNRKKGTKIGIIVLIVAVVVGIGGGLVAGSGIFLGSLILNAKAEPKVFSSNGLEITLTDEFIKTSVGGYTACYGSEDAVVFALEEKFDEFEGFENYSIEEYGNMVLENNDFGADVQLKNEDGLTYFEYQATNDETNDTYVYFAVVYKETDAFWLIQFAALEGEFDTYRQSFVEWAKTAVFE